MKGRVTEVFPSVQGEGIYLGQEQIFVRLFGCNLCCSYCDTKLDRFTEYEPHELFEEIELYKNDYRIISFTGGEPLLQKDFLREVMKFTYSRYYTHYLETNGVLIGELEKVIDYVDIIAMDFKLPTSAHMGKLWGLHKRFLKIATRKEAFVKAIICSSTTEEDILEVTGLIKDVDRSVVLVLQPNSNEGHGCLNKKLADFREICSKNGVTACVIPQVHKIVGIE